MKYFVTIISLFFFICSYAQPKKDSIYYAKLSQPGTKMIPVYNGKYKVFTQKVGDGKLKLLLLHGGPANCHEYFEIFPEYLLREGYTIYYYDQLGSYYSDQPDDSSIWNVSRFVEEIEEVRKGLGLEQFYLLGHSWGGMLAELYAAEYQQHLKGLILSNVPSFSYLNNDTILYNHFIDSLEKLDVRTIKALHDLKQYKPEWVDSISVGLTLSDTALSGKLSREYSILADSIYERRVLYHKTGPLPEPYVRNGLHINRTDRAKYMTGWYKTRDFLKAVQSITVPTLIISAKYDFSMPEYYPVMKERMSKTKCRIYICPNGAHFDMWDDSENYFSALVRFIKEVDKDNFDPNN